MSCHTFIPTIALIGGIGSGKSAVARTVNSFRPVTVIDADQIGHEVLDFPEVQQKIRAQFGTAVFNEQGKIIRKELARIVFGESKQHQESLKSLEKIVHPEIHRRLEQEIQAARSQGHVDAILIDAAVILEAGWQKLCDHIVFIECPFEQRLQRVTQNRGWSAAELTRRENHQLPLSEKRKLATTVVHNNQDLETAGHQLSRFIDFILQPEKETNN
ncbi:Dephospho-CoA kinase [Gimesia panareensis]|uniref:Dephospho-CoA kinase n=1 Tax=Gimesia panareensis TaxID=2527978 RepID=A0A518FSR4_9PLAN|nr:dephospho-CoA kinase [Gimesia panareensis]QDV19379.1 Dephospho-CoA kinase [Gimesia panareensis]